ncbi:MAG: DoxX family protein [Candidatus Falkowbacteria bacterium GW2011_GWF2_39_8]|uniref:DoxX family protein n=1 Tax=Candidatus Falkowbacteria bacterium GW2011_GWF2_39_8 TaxID=1618642 RepID=A0A0G0Q1M1_9BACT|nr:MAG: DoxX family protein [Candidatus Falkowbacteria bacterium GW2011_GWF2_39_8]
MENINSKFTWPVLRLLMGWTFAWAFFDKLFGLGFATTEAKAWVNGGSPTLGFLKFATKDPLAEFYQGLAGNPSVDWLFMIGLLLIGVALILGIGVRIASVSGIVMLLLMYSAVLLPENNPFLDDHIINSIVLIGVMVSNSGNYFGLGNWWSNTTLVKKYPFLR